MEKIKVRKFRVLYERARFLFHVLPLIYNQTQPKSLCFPFNPMVISFFFCKIVKKKLYVYNKLFNLVFLSLVVSLPESKKFKGICNILSNIKYSVNNATRILGSIFVPVER